MAFSDKEIREKALSLEQKGAPSSDVEEFIRRAKQEQTQVSEKPERRGFGEFLAGEFGQEVKEPETFTRGLIQSTIGSRGVLGVAQAPGRAVGSFLLGKAGAEANQQISQANIRLAEITEKLALRIKELPQDDPRRQSLISQVQENFKIMGMTDEAAQGILNQAETGQITPGQIVGTAVNAGLTVGLGGGAGRTAVTGFKTAGLRALQTGGTFAGFTTAEGLINDKGINELARDAAISFGIGALGSGLFSAAITLPLKGATSEKFVARLFRSGLGFGKASQVAEERQNRLVSEILIKHGAGTATQLKNRYQTLAREAEQQIQTALQGSKETFSTQSIMRDIVNAYKKQFPTSLTNKEIKAFVNNLPLAVLRRKNFVTAEELNQLRREITNKMLSPTTFTRATVQEGGTRQLLTAANVLSEKVKTAVPTTRGIFQKYSAYVKGFDALLNRLGATQGPVATGARVGGAAVSAGVGGFFGGFPGAAAGVIGEEFLRSTLGRTSIAVGLKKLGIAVEKLSQSEIVQLGNLLQKAGVSQTLSR